MLAKADNCGASFASLGEFFRGKAAFGPDKQANKGCGFDRGGLRGLKLREGRAGGIGEDEGATTRDWVGRECVGKVD